MQRCYYHPRIEAMAHCRRCKLPICFHCVESDNCPECIKLKRYLDSGHSARPARLVASEPPRRSITMDLMIKRMQSQLIDKEAAPARRPLKRKVKTKKTLRYGFLMPGIAPLVTVARSPLSRVAMLLAVALALGTTFMRQGSSYAKPPVDTAAAAVVNVPIQTEAREPEPFYEPLYLEAPASLTAPRTPAAPRRAAAPPAAAPAKHASNKVVRRFSYSLPVRDKEAPRGAAVSLNYPHDGNVLREVSFVRISVANPESISLVNVAIDGKPVQAATSVKSTIEVPIDTTSLKNGEHTLHIVALRQDGEMISSSPISISVQN